MLKSLVCLLALIGSSELATAQSRLSSKDWTLQAAEHLLNRAGFGGDSAEVAQLHGLGLEGAVAWLLEPRTGTPPDFFSEPLYQYGPRWERAMDNVADEDMSSEGDDTRRNIRKAFRREDKRQLSRYTHWWIERMVRAEDPLRDRMTLFWHGHFTSSFDDVRNSNELIVQHRLLRTNALGSFATMLNGIARDPAMLEYLDNDSNRVREPNENFARELLELFTLGEGNYEERDIVEAARAFTGWRDSDGEFEFNERQHDGAEKEVLGKKGELGGEDVLEILLKDKRTARHVAGRLVEYFEGRVPEPKRLDRYADVLIKSDWRVSAVLSRLFLDPEFYAADVVGERFASPLDFLVGYARRLHIEPSPRLVEVATRQLGQHLFHPPNVKGWPEGKAWITTSSVMRRANLGGVLLGRVRASELLAENFDPELGGPVREGMTSADDPMMGGVFQVKDDRVVRALDSLDSLLWQPEYFLTGRMDLEGTGGDSAIVEQLAADLLPRPLGPGVREELVHKLQALREGYGLEQGDFLLGGPDTEHTLRDLAFVILSLPEAQLH